MASPPAAIIASSLPPPAPLREGFLELRGTEGGGEGGHAVVRREGAGGDNGGEEGGGGQVGCDGVAPVLSIEGAAGAGVQGGLRRGMLYQTAAAPLVLFDAGEQTPTSTGALATAFHLSKADLEWFARKPSLFSPSRGAASLKVAVYVGRKGTTCGVSSGRLLDCAWEPWARLECWRERGGAGAADSLGYSFELLRPGADHVVPLAESSIAASKGGKFSIDLSAVQPLSRGSTPGCSPRGSGDFSQWPLGNYRGFVMSAVVQGEGRCSKPTEDATAFVALTAAVDLSMDAFVALAAAVDLSIHVMSTPHQRNLYMWTPRDPKPGWFRMRG